MRESRDSRIEAPTLAGLFPRSALDLAEIFDGLPRVMFSLKSLDGRYLMANQAFADRASCKTVAAVLGRRASELFAAELALSYDAQDGALLASGRPVIRQLELINRPDGQLGWYVTNKRLIHSASGRPVAIAAVSVDEDLPAGRPGVRSVQAAVAAARRRFAEPITASDLANEAGIATALLERRMRRLIGVSSRQLIVRVRVEEAVHRIATTDLPLAGVAAECGFSDQAAMSRQVKALLGVTPGSIRRAASGHSATRSHPNDHSALK